MKGVTSLVYIESKTAVYCTPDTVLSSIQSWKLNCKNRIANSYKQPIRMITNRYYVDRKKKQRLWTTIRLFREDITGHVLGTNTNMCHFLYPSESPRHNTQTAISPLSPQWRFAKRPPPPPPKTLQMRLNTSKVYILYYYAGTNWSICLLCLWLLSLKNKKKKKSIILWTVSKFLVILAVTDALEPLFILTHYGLLDDYKYTVSDPNN